MERAEKKGILRTLEQSVNPWSASRTFNEYPDIAKRYEKRIQQSVDPYWAVRATAEGVAAQDVVQKMFAAMLSDEGVPDTFKHKLMRAIERGKRVFALVPARVERAFVQDLKGTLARARSPISLLGGKGAQTTLIPVKLYSQYQMEGRSIELGKDVPIVVKGAGYKRILPFERNRGKISRGEAGTAAENAMKINQMAAEIIRRLREISPSLFGEYRIDAITIVPLAMLRYRGLVLPDRDSGRYLLKVLATKPPAPLPKTPKTLRDCVISEILRNDYKEWVDEYRGTHPLMYTLPVGQSGRVMEAPTGEKRNELKAITEQLGKKQYINFWAPGSAPRRIFSLQLAQR